MPIKQIPGGVTAAQGFTASGVHCGIRKNKSKRDLALIYADTLCSAAAVYTQNLVKGACILVTQQHLKKRQGSGGYRQLRQRQHLQRRRRGKGGEDVPAGG